METYSSEQENQSDDSGHVQHAATVSEGTDRLSQSSSDDRTSNTEECHIASHPHCTRTGSESSLHDKQLAFWLRHGIATLSSNGPLDKIHLSGDLLCSLGYKDDSSRSFCPLHMECQGLDCQGLPRSRGGSWDKDERWPDIRVIKHKPSAINFPDFPHSSQSSSSDAPVCEVSGTETSSSEGEDDDNDDVFTDLPQYHTYFNGAYRKGSTQRTRYREEVASPQDLAHGENFTARSEKKANEHGMEKKQKGARTSHWSESMSCLMSKLDQLNIDIEDALSTGSSPASTPSTKRRNKVSSSSDAENPMDRNVHGKGLRRSSRVGYRDLKGLTSSEFAGTRPKEDSAMRSLRRWKEKAELEAKEACDWLRAAGFPQYAQLYEDSQFPIDIAAVKRDHDFLDRDHVEPLCRRLNTLNKCASMKLDVNFQRKKGEDSDEESHCAISDKWTFQRTSRRWSRVDDIDGFLGRSDRQGSVGDVRMTNTTSSESVLTDLSEPEVSSLHSESSGGSDTRSQSGINSISRDMYDCSGRTWAESAILPDSMSLSDTFPHYRRDAMECSFNTRNEKPSRMKAKNIFKRMDTLRARGTPGKVKESGRTRDLVIGGPMLQQESEAIKSLHCVQIGNGDLASMSSGTARRELSFSAKSSSDSSQSENSSSAVSTPCSTESNSHGASKRGGMYLEDLDVLKAAEQRRVVDQNRKNEFHSQENLVVYIPKDHKPGTFPKALSIESLSPTDTTSTTNWQTGKSSLSRKPCSNPKEPRLATSFCPRGSRVSVYDNVPGSHLYASTGDLMDMEKDDLFPHLDDILQHVNGLQQVVDHWSKNVLPELQDDESLAEESGPPPFQSSHHITLDFEGNSVSDGRTTPSDMDRDGTSIEELDGGGVRERRDSGVGASLTRPNRRLRWHSFHVSHRLSRSVASLQISSQSAGQLNLLQKFSLLRLTAIMEKYSMSNKHGWTWSVPKFMKRMKVPDYKDKNVFGVPLIVHVQRTGQPLPQSIQQALRFLRNNCLDQVGLFRKSGVKSRIQALRQMNESSPESVNYEDQSAYDVADMVKQFFRDLPEPLLTSKLGETFLHIYQYVPKEQRLQAVQAAIMLMSDENREVLQTLLCFLGDVTSVEENQMTPMNVAVCLAPSLFHLNLLKKDNSPRMIQKKYATGRPDQKDLNENLAATQGLAHMITEGSKLFEVPHEIIAQSRNSYVEADVHPLTLEELGKQLEEEEGTYHTYLEGLIQGLLKEAKDKFKGWVSCPSIDSAELTYKKVGDENPLRLWKASVEVEAPPLVVLNRVLRERHLWDEDFLQWKVVETLDKQTEVFQYVLNSMAPHPTRDFNVLRTWRTDLPKGMCTLVAISVEHEEAPLMGGVRAAVLDSQYLIEPCGSGKSRLTHISRIDLKGHCLDWYNKGFGHLCASEVARIRDSFQSVVTEGPETKI